MKQLLLDIFTDRAVWAGIVGVFDAAWLVLVPMQYNGIHVALDVLIGAVTAVIVAKSVRQIRASRSQARLNAAFKMNP